MNNTEWQHKFLKAGTEYGMGDLSMMINIVSEILSEERNKVLDEVKREVENEMTDVEIVGSFRNSVKDMIDKETFSTIINQLKLK